MDVPWVIDQRALHVLQGQADPLRRPRPSYCKSEQLLLWHSVEHCMEAAFGRTPCDELVGNFSITNFPSEANTMSHHKYYPLPCEFKLRAVEQSITQYMCINTGVWFSDDSEGFDYNESSDEEASTSDINVVDFPCKKSCGLWTYLLFITPILLLHMYISTYL